MKSKAPKRKASLPKMMTTTMTSEASPAQRPIKAQVASSSSNLVPSSFSKSKSTARGSMNTGGTNNHKHISIKSAHQIISSVTSTTNKNAAILGGAKSKSMGKAQPVASTDAPSSNAPAKQASNHPTRHQHQNQQVKRVVASSLKSPKFVQINLKMFNNFVASD